VECTTTTVIEVEEASSNLEVGFTSSVLEIEKTSSSLYTETTPIYTYQSSEVTPLNSTHQHIDIASPSDYQYNLQKEDTFDDWASID
ncbi:16648_t:CDS:2, partial [Gigaspora rosea]